MEHKLANMQIAFDFLPVLKLRDHCKWRAKTKITWGGYNAHLDVRSKSNK